MHHRHETLRSHKSAPELPATRNVEDASSLVALRQRICTGNVDRDSQDRALIPLVTGVKNRVIILPINYISKVHNKTFATRI
jgi:hypothetical protein